MMRTLLDDHLFEHEAAGEAGAKHKVCAFVLTRFNVPLSGAREKGGFEEEERFKAWCRNRSEIFVKVCLPSVISQMTKPKAWIILFDETYLSETEKALKAIESHDWIVPVIVKRGAVIGPFRSLFTPEIVKRIEPNTQYVLTIRLDNDDALGKAYVEAAVRYAQSILHKDQVAPFWISFPYGIQWDGEEVCLLLQNNNAFLSLVEGVELFRSNKARTALSVNHGRVFEHGRVFMPTARMPMWLQFTHEENVSNKKNRSLLVFRDSTQVLRHFGINRG